MQKVMHSTNGTDGLNALVKIAVGSTRCANGSTRITSGLDTNMNGVLDDADMRCMIMLAGILALQACSGSEGGGSDDSPAPGKPVAHAVANLASLD